MMTIISNIVELLFEKIPFSRKSENAKFHIQDIYEAGQMAGYTKEEIDAIKSTDNVKGSKDILKLFRRYKHYILLEYQGIRLTYGYSIDYLAMPGIEDSTKQRGATLITIEKDGEFEIQPYRLTDVV